MVNPAEPAVTTVPADAPDATASAPTNGDQDPCPSCKDIEGFKKRKTVGRISWVQCEQCKAWHHWLCVAKTPSDPLEGIEKWYCNSCIESSLSSPAPLQIVYRPPPRKSSRQSRQLNYANLDAHLPADATRWPKLLQEKNCTEGYFKEMKAEDVNRQWVLGEEGMREPFWVREPEGLGMKMPDKDMSIGAVSEAVGVHTSVEVIDVASQSSLSHWTLAQWAAYYEDPSRDKVRNVISLEISSSPFSKQVEAPSLVKQLDWVENVWPNDLKLPQAYPTVQKYCLMSVKGCWTDWHVDFAGSSVYYHVLRGGKVFYFIRPTPANIKAYEEWSGSSERQENTWLGDMVDEVYKIELGPGNTMIIPTGWIHSVYTPEDSLVIGGNFVHSLNIGTQLDIYQVEINTKVPRKFRFPHFVKLLWFVALFYNDIFSSGTDIVKAAGDPSTPLSHVITPRILEGLKRLSAFLIDQTARIAINSNASAERKRIAKENIPYERVTDPVKTSRDLRRHVLSALGEKLDADCFEPSEASPSKEGAVGASETSTGKGKGKAGSPAVSKGTKRKSEQMDGSKDGVVNGGTPTGKVKKAASAATVSEAKSKATADVKAKPATESKAKPAAESKTKVAAPSTPAADKPKASAKRDQGETMSNTRTAMVERERVELKADPKGTDKSEKRAEVKEHQTTQIVVRRRVEEDGTVVLETRTVITIVETARLAPINPTPSSAGPSTSTTSAPSAPSPLAITSVPPVDSKPAVPIRKHQPPQLLPRPFAQEQPPPPIHSPLQHSQPHPGSPNHSGYTYANSHFAANVPLPSFGGRNPTGPHGQPYPSRSPVNGAPPQIQHHQYAPHQQSHPQHLPPHPQHLPPHPQHPYHSPTGEHMQYSPGPVQGEPAEWRHHANGHGHVGGQGWTH